MKLALLFPPPSEDYANIKIGHEPVNNAPQTAHAVLAACVRQLIPEAQIVAVSDQKPGHDGSMVYAELSDYVKAARGADVVGFTCWFHNQRTVLELAQRIRAEFPYTTIVLGGPNVASFTMAKMILEQYPEIDFIVRRDGERALPLIMEYAPINALENLPEPIPNIVYRRKDGTIHRQYLEPVELNSIPHWDFRDTKHYRELLAVFDSRSPSYRQTLPRVGIFSLRGCVKAVKGVNEGRPGVCSFCTTGETTLRIMQPRKFWDQITWLALKHGVKDFLIADDIFAISPEYVEEYAREGEKYDAARNFNFRAYAYPTTFQIPETETMARNLRRIGVRNIFLGIETFDGEVAKGSNKDYFPPEMVADTVALLGRHSIDSTIALLLGLPYESTESLKTDYRAMEMLLERFGARDVHEGRLVRIDLSAAMPLIGTPWYARLVRDARVKEAYLHATGRQIEEDPTPDYHALRDASLPFFTSITPQDMRDCERRIADLALRYFRPEMVGGFAFQEH